MLLILFIFFSLLTAYVFLLPHIKTYRLGDFVMHKREFKNSVYRWFYCMHHKHSIAHKYNQATSTPNNNQTLFKISKSFKNLENVVSIHLRLGDVIDDKPQSVHQFLNEQVNLYIKPLSFYKNIADLLKTSYPGINTILLISASHKSTKDPNKSQLFIKGVKEFFESKHYNVKVRWNMDADEDFKLMSNTRLFVPSGGGYSELIKTMVLLNNNIVL